MRILLTALCFLALATLARCQLVQIGPPDPIYCEKLRVNPNLILDQKANISGRLIDQTGAPFQGSLLELRLYLSTTKQSTVAKVSTNHDGQFRFDSIKAGKYRLIASPTRAFQQPSELRCDSDECEFAIALQVNPTELPDSQCPVR